MQPPPSNQNSNRPPQERDGDRSDTETSTGDPDVASGGESRSADSLDDESEEEEEGLPEKAWVRRRIKKLEKRADFKELMQEWDSTELDYKCCMDKTKRQEQKQILEKFEEETVGLFIDCHLRFLTEPVVQTYIQKILAIICNSPQGNEVVPLGTDRLPLSVLEGRRGLCWYTFYVLLNRRTGTHATRYKPKLHESRPNGPRHFHKKSHNLAGRYGTNWIAKLDELFRIEDDDYSDEGDRKKIRQWDDADFRQKARRLGDILTEDLGDRRLATQWQLGLGRMASRYLWAIPLFAKEKLAHKPYIDKKTLNPTIDIIVPTLSSRYVRQNDQYLRLQDTLLEKEIYTWLYLQPKREDDSNQLQQSLRVDLRGEYNKIRQLRQREDVIDPEKQEALLQRTREVYCDPIRLFCELQQAASHQLDDVLILDPGQPYDSPEGAKTIGLEGRNRQSMLAHIRALHPHWSRNETEQTFHQLMENVKDLGSMLGYMTRDDNPVIDIHGRTGRATTIRCRGAPLLPSFGDVLHLKQVDKYLASLTEARQTRSVRTTPHDSREASGEETTEGLNEAAFARFATQKSQKRRRLATEESNQESRGRQSVEADQGQVRGRMRPVIFNTETDTEDDQTDANVGRVDSSGWEMSHGSVSSMDR